MKFVLFNMDTDRPGIYFANVSNAYHHAELIGAVGLNTDSVIRGNLAYHPELTAPDGSDGVYSYRLNEHLHRTSFQKAALAFTVLAAAMPILNDNLVLHARNAALPYSQHLLPLYRESRIDLVFDEDIFGETSFQAMNSGEAFGLLKVDSLVTRGFRVGTGE